MFSILSQALQCIFGELKLGLQSGNTKFGSKSVIFPPREKQYAALCSRRLSKLATFVPCDLGVTLGSKSAPLLCYVKLCASFLSHRWIQTGVTVRKPPNWGKICFELCDLDLWPLTLIFCMDTTFVNGNNSWNFHDDQMTETLWKRCDRQTEGLANGRTDRRTNRSVLRAASSQLKTDMPDTSCVSWSLIE